MFMYTGVYVNAINPTGLAGQEGSLKEGDKLVAANGKPLIGLTHKQSAGIIRVLYTSTCRMCHFYYLNICVGFDGREGDSECV